ncbi:MAG: hypothetical protein ACFFCQ_14220 [Promethearchaeota archaeon]
MLTIPVDDGSLYGFRLLRSAIFSIAILTFSLRNEGPSPARKAILWYFVIGFSSMTAIHLIWADLFNLMNWSIIIVHTGFILVYG